MAAASTMAVLPVLVVLVAPRRYYVQRPRRRRREGMSRPTSLGSDGWRLYRAPLRDEGAAGFPALDEAEGDGEVIVPGNLQLQLGFDDPWLDSPS